MAKKNAFVRYAAPDFSTIEGVPPEFTRRVQDEFSKIAGVLSVLQEGFIQETFVAPDKPRTGMVRLADGTSWNPGTGRGIYWYDGNVPGWVKLV